MCLESEGVQLPAVLTSIEQLLHKIVSQIASRGAEQRNADAFGVDKRMGRGAMSDGPDVHADASWEKVRHTMFARVDAVLGQEIDKLDDDTPLIARTAQTFQELLCMG